MKIGDLELENFESEQLGLFIIVERTSKVIISDLITVRSDLIALYAFCKWLKSQEFQEQDTIPTKPEMYALRRVALMSSSGEILDTSNFCIATGDKAKEMYDDLVVRALEAEND